MKNRNKETIVFTNGIFDILHIGHVELLKFAKNLGDKLIVGINSDRSTRLLKGNNRPIYTEHERKTILESIRYVDKVIIFDDADTINVIQELRPDVVVKGGEWTADEVRKRDKIPEEIEVKVFPLILDHSTTNILEKIKNIETCDKSGTNNA